MCKIGGNFPKKTLQYTLLESKEKKNAEQHFARKVIYTMIKQHIIDEKHYIWPMHKRPLSSLKLRATQTSPRHRFISTTIHSSEKAFQIWRHHFARGKIFHRHVVGVALKNKHRRYNRGYPRFMHASGQTKEQRKRTAASIIRLRNCVIGYGCSNQKLIYASGCSRYIEYTYS